MHARSFRSRARRTLRPGRVVLVVILGLLGTLGARMLSGRAHGPRAAGDEAAPSRAPADASLFAGLRPGPGDRMTPPRIGFRWSFDLPRALAGRASQATGAAGERPAGSVSQAGLRFRFVGRGDSVGGPHGETIRFRIHLAGADGAPLVTETLETHATLDLPT
jgi:hypothetical protein